MIRRPPRSTRTDTLFPYTTLFRSKDQGRSDAAIVAAALNMIRTENFVYTLRPPTLGSDSIDEFLFDTRRGFCEHYSSTFTFLMRAAGLPARIVTVYPGGGRNAVGGYRSEGRRGGKECVSTDKFR